MAFPVVYTPEPVRPSGGPQPGTKTLLSWIVSPSGWDAADSFDDQNPSNLGIYNPRDVCGNVWPFWKCKGSQHARGAAGDAGFPIIKPGGHPEGHKLAAWLVTNHAHLGIQEVIWAGRRWHNKLGVIPHAQWPRYTGRSDHYDHVHFAQTEAAARFLTLAMILAVAPSPIHIPEPTPPVAPPIEEDEMQHPVTIVRGNNSSAWFATDGITRQWLNGREHAAILCINFGASAEIEPANITAPELEKMKAWTWPQAAVDSIRLVGSAPPPG